MRELKARAAKDQKLIDTLRSIRLTMDDIATVRQSWLLSTVLTPTKIVRVVNALEEWLREEDA